MPMVSLVAHYAVGVMPQLRPLRVHMKGFSLFSGAHGVIQVATAPSYSLNVE